MSPYLAAAGCAIAPDVVLVPIEDGSARLLDLDGGFYALSQTAAEMLQSVIVNGVSATINQMAARYDVEPDRIGGDLTKLLGELRRRGLIDACGWRSRRRGLRRAMAAAVVRPILRLIDGLPGPQQAHIARLMVFSRLCIAAFGFGPTLGAWRDSLAARVRAPPPSDAHKAIEEIDAAVRHLAAGFPAVACKERALSCWYRLSSLGIPAALVLGIQLFPLAAHCWCRIGNRTLTDFAERCDTFQPVLEVCDAAYDAP